VATLKEVAALAAVSTATASLALNGGPVNEKTRQRVIESASQLNYVPNAIGRSLITGKTKTIEFLILTSDQYADTVRRTSLFYYIIEGIMSVSSKAGFGLRFDVQSHDDPALPTYFEKLAGDSAIDGLAVIPQFARDYGFMEPLIRRKFPYIFLRPARFGETDNYVDMGNFEGGRIVATVFANSGCRRIGLINGPELHFDSIERERGFMNAILPTKPAALFRYFGDFTIESGYAGMADLLRQGKMDAVFCSNDYMAAGAIRKLTEVGLKIPDDISVVGYDNNDIGTALTPSLTTVDNRFLELGARLGRGLLALMDGRAISIRETSAHILIERDSHRKARPTKISRARRRH
jgi:DNA-binding LacI/PurR family transcriptional regulator